MPPQVFRSSPFSLPRVHTCRQVGSVFTFVIKTGPAPLIRPHGVIPSRLPCPGVRGSPLERNGGSPGGTSLKHFIFSQSSSTMRPSGYVVRSTLSPLRAPRCALTLPIAAGPAPTRRSSPSKHSHGTRPSFSKTWERPPGRTFQMPSARFVSLVACHSFGASSANLFHVSVVWTVDVPSKIFPFYEVSWVDKNQV